MNRQPRSPKKRIRNPKVTRTKLLQATIDLVTEKGAAALSLKEAALRANVSRGVAYLHFEDRDQLLEEAKAWISEGLQNAVRRFDKNASTTEQTFQISKLVLTHPEATKLLITSVMAGTDSFREHRLYKFVLNLVKELKSSGTVRPDIDIEIVTYLMFGSIAATVMLGAQRAGENVDGLAKRFANEWISILRVGLFLGDKNDANKRTKSASRPRKSPSHK